MSLDQLEIDTVVVGAGQAGVAMSEHLTALKIPHVVLEKNRIAEAWRTRRWDSLVANGPCWHDRFPNMEFDADPDSFVHHDQVAEYFEKYAKQFNAPIYTNTEVKKVSSNRQTAGFTVETSQGTIKAQRVVVATGPFQKAIIPAIAPKQESLYQIHSDQYKNPQQLPAGAVLVVGSGSSGVQIADELNRAGKKVYLSVGAHERPPRIYRQRDNVWWLGVLGGWDSSKTDNGPLKGLAVSGAHGGHSIDFRSLALEGITLLGMTKQFDKDTVYFQNDLQKSLQEGDQAYLAFLDAADAYVQRTGIDLPEEPEARKILKDTECIQQPILTLNLAQAGIGSIIWASGFGYDYSWLDVNAFDADAKPKHKLGVSSESGIYFVGLPYLYGRGSSFIWGVWHDAKRIAGHIDIQRHYLEYQDKHHRELHMTKEKTA
ncbi:NAD(P)/FAD-dependent oxidoreductase [Acinetobacter sp.]|jgi:putative flavoprotein involved in K+ transport|uniref:flavin-containing monooxygenase n=1 Tax=Acinetobacter sp. TaxID=472 RepID=UPI0028224D70|nr:NAD(P)/FAD-dependent oxidoreductase [Acinetobacter sp.]MDR0237822.1 NAD(P)/FAD-dependent oxidoreductase [Acinetobacter sp.]